MSTIRAMFGYRDFCHTLVTDAVMELDDLMDELHEENCLQHTPDTFEVHAKFAVPSKRLQSLEAMGWLA